MFIVTEQYNNERKEQCIYEAASQLDELSKIYIQVDSNGPL
jgi:hypothetical protein